MTDFAAIDFETANGARSSVCSVGVVVVRGGQVAEHYYSLIKPEPEYYTYWCTRVHGLCQEDTQDAPIFPEVWEQIAPLLSDGHGGTLPLVAHNSPFDEGCLRAVMRVYQMDWPDGLVVLDTLRASRHALPQLPNHQLQTVALACGYDLRQHHNALADAEACAAIAREIL